MAGTLLTLAADASPTREIWLPLIAVGWVAGQASSLVRYLSRDTTRDTMGGRPGPSRADIGDGDEQHRRCPRRHVRRVPRGMGRR